MACHKKEITGSCGHFQCPFSSETDHGYECIDIFHAAGGSFCEVGMGCLPKCSYSWEAGDNSDTEKAAIEWNKQMDEELKQLNEEMRNNINNQTE